MSPDEILALGMYVTRFALPALVFSLLSQRNFAEIMNAKYLGAFALASLSVFFLILSIGKIVRGRPTAKCASQALGSSVSNSGFIGYPIAILVIVPAASVALALGMIIENGQ